jgi:hypothetical protein
LWQFAFEDDKALFLNIAGPFPKKKKADSNDAGSYCNSIQRVCLNISKVKPSLA